VAGVKPPVHKRLRRGLRSTEVALRDVLAFDKNLAIARDPDVHAGDRLADRASARAERMVEADDGCGLGEPVALNHREAQAAPELFQRRIERGGADDEAPELQSELR